MNSMTPFSTDEWMQHYPNTPITDEPSDATLHPHSTQPTSGQAAPKPVRRRSRASRRTPTTLLNASPNDFRALVQRFTGCDSNVNAASASASASASANSVMNQPKGPLNIDFARNMDTNESSSRHPYFDDQVRSYLHVDQMQSVGGLQAGYGMEMNASVIYEAIDESSIVASPRDGGSHGYNV